MKQPKEKARKLIAKFETIYSDDITSSKVLVITLEHAKHCALICCDEIIKELQIHWEQFDKLEMYGSSNPILAKIDDWQAVKKELIK